MFLKLWNFLRGYVRIEIIGFSVERLINQASENGVVFMEAQRVCGNINAVVSNKDFAQLDEIAARTGTVIKLQAHAGLPAIARRFRKRLVLALGGLFFIGALVLLTSFVWRIDIIGADRIDTYRMLEFLAENGFKTGVLRYGIAYRDIENLLITEFDDIAWVSLRIEGTLAQIRLVETIERPEIIDFSVPTDIVAAKDGIIIQMATSRGTPMFRPGDVVRQGDIIVSGRLTIAAEYEEPTYEYVRASAEVWARLYYRMEFEIPLVFFEKSFTGRTQKVYSVSIGENEFTMPHRSHNFIYFDTIVNRRELTFGENYPLPAAQIVTEHHELTRRLHRRTYEEAVAIGEEMVLGRIEEELADDAHIVSKEINFTEAGYMLKVEVFLVTIERIDQIKELMFENQQMIN